MKLETPAEACTAMAVLIAGADDIGTMEESRFMYETIAAQSVFAGLDRDEFRTLVRTTTDWVWSAFPTQGGRLTDDGMTALVAQISAALPAQHRESALRAAVGLARADGVSPPEEALLDRLCRSLEVDPDLVGEFRSRG